MPFTPPGYASIRDAILRDIRSQLPDADIGSDSDNFIRSAAVAASIEGLYQHQAWFYRQIFPDTADDAEVLRHAAIRGIKQRAAVAAGGRIDITGTTGVVINSGVTVKHVATGALLTIAESGTIAAGAVQVPVVAQTDGVSMNGISGAVMLTSPPLGADAMATISAPLVGGVDIESVASVLVRLLDLLRRPPAGGADYDYRRWALEVEGVDDALVIPRRRGGGTVDVVITATTGIPSAEVIAACKAYIDTQCSVIADVWVYAPTIRDVNATARVQLAAGFTMAMVQVAAQKAYDSLLNSLKPNEGLKRSQIEAMVSNLAGVLDRVVDQPAGNVKASNDPALIGWIRPGALVLGVME